MQRNGGILNGSTRFDFTNYFEVVPVATRWRRCSGPRPIACAASTIDAGEPQQPAGRGEERGAGQRAEPALRRLPVARPPAAREHRTGTTPTTSTATSSDLDAATLERRAAVLQDLLRAEQRRAGRQRRLRPGPGEGAGSSSTSAASRARTLPPHAGHHRAAADRGEADDRGRPLAQRPALARRATTCPARLARVLRDGAAPPDPGRRARTAGSTRSWCRSAGSPARWRAAQPRLGNHVRLPGADAVDGLPVPRRGALAEGDRLRDRRGDRAAASGPGGRGDAGARAGEGPERVLRGPRPALRIRPGGSSSRALPYSTTTRRR